MLINEIFNTSTPVKWKETDEGWSGFFEYDNENFTILLNEFDVKLTKQHSLIDFGFKRNDSFKSTNDTKNASTILGIILQAFIPKVNKLSPDMILFGVHFKNGSVASRKSLYSRIASLFCKGSSYQFVTDWIKTANGEYKIISKNSIDENDLKIILDFAATIPEKD